MPIPPPLFTLRLANDSDTARQDIAAATDALIQSGYEHPRLRVIAAGETLTTETISTLISALRKLREFGGAIELIGETVPVRAAIALNGLLHIFAFPLEDHDSQCKLKIRKHHYPRYGMVASILVLLILLIRFGSYYNPWRNHYDPTFF
jgi:alpha-D-ribose 1-methylphosphonate 5-triphosphate synthase subunit PhnH